MKWLYIFALVLYGVHGGVVLADDENAQQNSAIEQTQVDQSLRDLNDRLTKARAVPNFENGKPAGYKIVQPESGGMDEKLELKNGDVIQGVNGQKADDPKKAFEMMSSLRTTNQLKIVRDGNDQTVDQNGNHESNEGQDNPTQ